MKKHHAPGFSLIELLVVIGIIVILLSLVTISFNSSRMKSRDARRIHDISVIQTGLEMYYSRNKSYPNAITPGQTFAENNITYIDPVPSNPSPRREGTCPDTNYVYTATNSNQSYTLSFCLTGATGSVAAGRNVATPGSINLLGFDSAATALFARFSGTLSDTDKENMNALIVSAKANGWWNKLDVFYVFAIGTNATDSRLNWKSTSFNASGGVSPTWTAYRGITGNGSTQYLSTNYNPTTNGTNFVSGSQSLGIYSRTEANGAYVEVGGYDGTCTAPFIRSGGSTLSYIASCSASSLASSSSLGFFLSQRVSTTTNKFYRNGTLTQTDSISSSSVLNTTIFIGARSNAGTPVVFSPRQIAAITIGGAMTDTEALTMANDINTYMTAIGANVY